METPPGHGPGTLYNNHDLTAGSRECCVCLVTEPRSFSCCQSFDTGAGLGLITIHNEKDFPGQRKQTPGSLATEPTTSLTEMAFDISTYLQHHRCHSLNLS